MDRACWMSRRGRVTLPGQQHSAALMRLASIFRRRRFVWHVRHTPRCDSSELMLRRFRSSPQRSMRSSTASACVTWLTLTSRFGRRSGCCCLEGASHSPYGTCPNAPWVSAPYTPLSERTARWTSTFRWDRTSFSSAIPSRAGKALLDAGFVSPSCQQVPQIWRLSDADQLFEIVTEGTVRAAATIRSQSPSARDAIRAAVRESVMDYRRGDHFEVPMPAVVASAVKG